MSRYGRSVLRVVLRRKKAPYRALSRRKRDNYRSVQTGWRTEQDSNSKWRIADFARLDREGWIVRVKKLFTSQHCAWNAPGDAAWPFQRRHALRRLPVSRRVRWLPDLRAVRRPELRPPGP